MYVSSFEVSNYLLQIPVMAGNTFEKVKLRAKEVVEIFTDSDTYLRSKDENEDMDFSDEARN